MEAYIGEEDRACHASRGLTPRTKTLFGPPGYSYVYLIYGMYNCLNVVTEHEGYPAALLLRALEPLEGFDEGLAMNGPGKLCRAMGISRGHNALDMTRGSLFIAAGESPARVKTSPRIGVDYAGPWARKPWRFFDATSRAVSKPRR